MKRFLKCCTPPLRCAALLALILSLALGSALAATEPIAAGNVRLTLIALGYDPFLLPPDITEDHTPLTLVFAPESELPAEELLPSYEAFFAAARLVDLQGAAHYPGLLIAPNDSGGGTIMGGNGRIVAGKDSFPGMACLIFAIPKGTEPAELTLEVKAETDIRSVPLCTVITDRESPGESEEASIASEPIASDPAASDPAAHDPGAWDPAALLGLPFPADDLYFDVAPLRFHFTAAVDLPGHPPVNYLNDLPACMVGFAFGQDFGEGSREAKLAVYSAATLLAQDGEEYAVYASGAYEHDRWDLYFGLPAEHSIYDCVLILRLPGGALAWPMGGYEYGDARRRPTTTADGADAAQAAAEPEPVQAAHQPLSVEDAALAEAERVVAALRAETAEPWAAEMLAGAQLAVDRVGKPDKRGDTPVTVTVTMPGLHSGLKSGAKLGKQDAAALLRGALERAGSDTVGYSLKLSVNVEGEEPSLRWGSANDPKGLAKFISTKATAARKSFEVAALQEAVAALLVDAAVSKPKLDASGGLAAVQFTGSVSHGAGAMDTARNNTYSELANVPLANGWDRDAIRAAFDKQYAQAQKRDTKKTARPFGFAVDLRALAELGKESCADALLFAAQPNPYDDAVDALCQWVWDLPDHPRPATGRLSGESRGTKVTIRTGGGNGDVYVRFVHAGSERLQVSCYIREGAQVTLRVPSGNYELRYGRGDARDWQGEANAFGYEGAYGYGDMRVMGSNYEHTVTLTFVPDGNMPVSSTSLDSFLGR